MSAWLVTLLGRTNLVGKVQTLSNVTRLSRSLRLICSDSRLQVIEYSSGVGTGGTNVLGTYSFICVNYCDGDETILVGFSRRAFIARSVAGMVTRLGLLTRQGMDFYPIYKDMQNWRTTDYDDTFPDTPFDNKPEGEDAGEKYQQMLVESAGKGELIKVKAVAVWDTVDSLGVLNVSWLAKMGMSHSTKEYRFFDTDLSDRIEYAFQALALDEHRVPFSPTIWERTAANQRATDLRQIWFPGNHSNVGGRWEDAGVTNMALACGCYGLFPSILPEKSQWAIEPTYKSNTPGSEDFMFKLSGFNLRTPGMYMNIDIVKRVDPQTGAPTDTFLEDTNERMHSSVRVRLALKGLALNDRRVWKAPALDGKWRLRKMTKEFHDPIPKSVKSWDPKTLFETSLRYRAADQQRPLSAMGHRPSRWVWEYCGPKEDAPPNKLIVEEPLGPYERQLLRLSGGAPNVYEHAENMTSETGLETATAKMR
ncbi:hypothetical protein B0H63DRAFT_496321 [Podospora didyma]|uniref:T6SS Phospholipase effector Tle1-like catalytic domain-containing protein n=1 Tax=Podospora didyma TaxID=330526 RepID=A0AAE0KF29_9PEZI|nr:hypothetical protein B0H63DRAFT_496321 [Podospora didyma]